FTQMWNREYAEKIKQSRLRRGIIKVEAQRTTPEPIEGIDFVVSRTGNGNVQTIEYLTAADEPVWTGVPKPKAPEVRRCKAGRKCLKFVNRRPAPVQGKGDYCTRNCSESATARAKRARKLTEGTSETLPNAKTVNHP